MIEQTRVEWDGRLARANVQLFTVNSESVLRAISADKVFLAHQLLVIDGIDWGDALSVIQRRGLDPTPRAFKEPYTAKPVPADVQAAVEEILQHARQMFPRLYPWTPRVAHSSFRPMVTGPEPLHYDSYGGDYPLVTAYINVSDEPRTYRIGWTFEQLVEQEPETTLAAFKERKRNADDASYPIRMRTQKGRPPLGKDAPRHTIELAPGAIWFFNAKTVSHEVVHGTGAIGIGWEVPTSGAKLQREILKGIR